MLATQRGNSMALSIVVVSPERFENLSVLLKQQNMYDYYAWLRSQKLGHLVLQDVRLISASNAEVESTVTSLVSGLKDLP
jgi:hypothetical protein